MTPPGDELRSAFGDIDIYLFDQLARGRFDRRHRVLDAGCGDGRNLVWFLRNGFTCFGIDRDEAAVAQVRALATRLAPTTPLAHFVTGELDDLPWSDGSMDGVIASAVLHFVRDEAHFARIVQELWRVLAPGGLLFSRMASTIGLEAVLGPVAGSRVRLPDGTDRFVVDQAMLLDWTERLGL